MKTPPESLRRILAKQAPKAAATMPDSLRRVLAKRQPEPARDTYSTVVWADGEVWREVAPGIWKQLPDTSPTR